MMSQIETRWRAWWLRRTSWMIEALRSFDGDAVPSRVFVAVVGREHYLESKRRLPIRSWREVVATLDLERSASATRLVNIGSWNGEHREVTVFDFPRGLPAQTSASIFCVPESLLLERSLGPSQVGVVTRGMLTYFVSRDGTSQIKGGLINSPESYAIGVGIPSNGEVRKFDVDTLTELLPSQLSSLAMAEWVTLIRPGLREQILSWLRPAALASAAISIGYLIVVSSYLLGMSAFRERQITQLGPEVGSLLALQREVGAAKQESESWAMVARAKPQSHRVWESAALVWGLGGTLSALTLSDRKLMIQGTVPVATDLLGALTKLPSFEGAKFAAPVRKVGDREEFSITLQLRLDATATP